MSRHKRRAIALSAVLLALAVVALLVAAQGDNRSLVPVIVLGPLVAAGDDAVAR